MPTPAPASPISLDLSKPFDLGQHLFDTITSMNRVRMMELGITPAPKAPRMRQLDVRDDHCVALLTAIADSLLTLRRLGIDAPLPLLEMQAALNSMVRE